MARRKMKLAARGRRFGAGCIDAVPPVLAYLIIMATSGANKMPGYGYGYGYGYEFEYGYDYGSSLTGTPAVIVAAMGIFMLAWFIVECVFYAKSQSIGKKILGLQVISSIDGKPLGFWKMIFREFIVKSASNVLALGYIWILIDEKNRGWHDKILDTYVVDLKESERLAVREAAPPVPQAPSYPVPPERHDAPISAPVSPQNNEIKMPAAEEAAAEVKMPAAEEAAVTDIQVETVVEAEAEVTEAAKGAAAAIADTASEAAETLKETATEATETITETAAEAAEKAVGAADEATETVKEAAEEVKEAAEVPAEEKKVIRVSMSMKKEELLDAAREIGVEVDAKATKQEIIDTIKKAVKG